MSLKSCVHLTFMAHLNLDELHFKCPIAAYGYRIEQRRFRVIKEAGGSGQNHGEYQHLNWLGVEKHRRLVGSWGRRWLRKRKGS